MSALMASSLNDIQNQQKAFVEYSNLQANALSTIPEADPEQRFHALAATGDRQISLDLLDKLDRYFACQPPC